MKHPRMVGSLIILSWPIDILCTLKAITSMLFALWIIYLPTPSKSIVPISTKKVISFDCCQKKIMCQKQMFHDDTRV